MDKINFLQLFGEIDDKILRQANDALNLYQRSQEGVSFRADYSRRSRWKTVIASVAGTAAVMFGVFVLLLNIGKLGLRETSEQSEVGSSSVNSGIIAAPEQSGSSGDLTALYMTMYYGIEDRPDKYTDECFLSKSEDHIYFVDCMTLENCKVKIEGTNNFPSRLLEYSAPDMNSFMSTTDEEQIGFKATMTVTDPEKPARAVLMIGSSTENLAEMSE